MSIQNITVYSHPLRKAIAALLLCVCSFTMSYADTSTSTKEEIAAIKNKLELLSTNNLSETQKKTTLETLQLALSRYQTAAELDQQAIRYKNALTNSPSALAKLEKASTNFRAKKLPKNLSSLALIKIDSLLKKEEVLLSSKRKRNAEIDTEISQENTINMQTALNEANEQIKTSKMELQRVGAKDGTPSADYYLGKANHASHLARADMLEQKLLSRNARVALLRAENKLLSKQIEAAEINLFELQKRITDHRQSDAERRLDVANKRMNSLDNKSQIVHNFAEENIQRANELITLIADHDAVMRQKENVAREAQRIDQKHTSLIEQIRITQLESSPEFGAALLKQSDRLTSNSSTKNELKKQEQAMTKSRLAQFQIDALGEPEAQMELTESLANLADDPENRITDDDNVIIDEILQKRESILKKLSLGYAQYIDDLNSLTSQTRSLEAQNRKYAQLLNQQLLLMPTASTIGLQIFSEVGNSLVLLSRGDLWRNVMTSTASGIAKYRIESLLALIIIVLLFIKKHEMTTQLSAMKDIVGKVHRDNMSYTLMALLISSLIALPKPLILLSFAGVLTNTDPFSHALAKALTYGAFFYLVIQLSIQFIRKDGLAELHFKWKKTTLTPLRNKIHWFKWALLPGIILSLLIEFQAMPIVRDSLGRVVFIVVALITALFIYQIFNFKNGMLQVSSTSISNSTQWQLRHIIFPLMVLLPILVAIMSIAGYHYAASQLAVHLITSIMVVLFGIIIFSLAKRAAAISERRLSLERIRTKRALAVAQAEDKEHAEGEGLPTALDLQEIDLLTISNQTKALLKTITVVAVGLALWNIWSGFLPAFQPLDDIRLWQVSETLDGIATLVDITLGDLFLTFTVIAITFLASRNIPGLLEITLLSRMSLATGTNYTATTISRYIIIITGTVIALQLLGAQWSKLQWLVAALSVGLGFGLQEIVANFVSGIVILFERPIRIGDTVTVGDQFGTVSRIRIRATTIVDWDRREVIIPNKTFITERLINWTLTDPIIRTIISVGVAYGSDVNLVERCLLEIAQKNTKVLTDPPPIALFRSFGESTLDFHLRVFIKGIQDMSPVTHELHVAIEREFRQHGIQISFPQRDLHFGAKPIEIRLLNADD